MMNWAKLWMKIFGRTTFIGLDMGFWVSLVIVILIVILMNLIFWMLKPQKIKNKNIFN